MSVYYSDEHLTLHLGDALKVARDLPSGSVDCIVTSPPYYGLRDYGNPRQYGLEASPAKYVETMRLLFAELRRVLSDDGTLWLNLGDSYAKEYAVHTARVATTGQPGNQNNSGIHSRPGKGGRNARSVWSISAQPFPGAHFAVMPVGLAERCIQAGCKPNGTVLDPFSGSGTTGYAASRLGRRYVGIDLSADYLKLSLQTRLQQTALLDGEVV